MKKETTHQSDDVNFNTACDSANNSLCRRGHFRLGRRTFHDTWCVRGVRISLEMSSSRACSVVGGLGAHAAARVESAKARIAARYKVPMGIIVRDE